MGVQPQLMKMTLPEVYKGDTTGLNLGMAWKGHLFERVDYTLGLDGYKL